MLSIRVQMMLRQGKISPVISLQEKINLSTAGTFTINKRNKHIQSSRALNRLESQLLTRHSILPAISLVGVRYASSDIPDVAEVTNAVSENIATTTAEPIGQIIDVVTKKTIVDLPDIPVSPPPALPVTDLGTGQTIVNLPDIPEPPPPLPITSEEVASQILNAAGEPSLASIGLGGWSPVGMIQNCMEFLHVTCDLPWWGAIAVGTLAVRTIIFPLVILAQRNAAKMNNHMPQMQLLQLKMTEARQSGNALDSARYAQEMMLFMKEKQLNPLKNMIVPLAQAPLFISFFMGLRGMANAPIESMRDGGIFWFTDLTVADPTFMLPVITSATLYLTIEIGTDSARLSAQNMMVMKYILRALPVVIFPFTMNFPAAILTYWACSNFISLAQVSFLRIPAVRDYFKIEKMVTHTPDTLPIKKKGFVKGMQDSWQNIKISKEIEERQRLDEIRFAKAGQGPVIKTFKHDPTKQRPTTPIEAKPK